MGAVKIFACDTWFSKCVRERANWACERCGSQFPEGQDRRGLHCSHFYGRGNWATRFHPDNAFAHCYGCHQYLGSHPTEFHRWAMEKMGEGCMVMLREITNDTRLGRLARRSRQDIAAHYRAEHLRMSKIRQKGHSGRLEFEPWH